MSTLWLKVVDSDGDTPLMIAAHEGNVEAREGQSFVRYGAEGQFFWNLMIRKQSTVAQCMKFAAHVLLCAQDPRETTSRKSRFIVKSSACATCWPRKL